jgi:hypothetical protein
MSTFQSVNDITAGVVKQRMQWVLDAQKARDFLMRQQVAVDVLLRMLPAGSWTESWSDRLAIHISVTDMAQVAPVIESLEAIYGVSFNKEETHPEHAQREWRDDKCPFLQVTAHISDDADAKCRRVVIGEQIVPKYEVVCDGEAPSAAPAPADEGVPF